MVQRKAQPTDAYALNKKASFDYEILEKIVAGIVLTGQEVKSVRLGQVSLKGAYVVVTGDEAWLLNAHISPYQKAGKLPGYDPVHSRKLLLHKREIERLRGKLQEEGLTAVPLSVYPGGSRIKVTIGLGQGKKKYQKKETLKRKAVDREIRRVMKGEE